MSYNLCNLPKQITAANGKTVKYTYFADGTKFKAVDAIGNGLAYTGSLRWSVENGTLTPESMAITGGRAVCDSTNMWSANYYITDHLGSVRVVTDAEGEVLDTYDYMPYGSEFTTDTDNITDYRFTGKEKQTAFGNSNIYDSFARFQNTYGRFMSIDPKAEEFYHISPYTYCAGDPVNLVDPDGEVPLKLLFSTGKAIKKAFSIYKKTNRLSVDDFKKIGLDEYIDFCQNIETIFASSTSYIDKITAGIEIITGLELKKYKRYIEVWLGAKTQKHHIIPKAVYNKLNANVKKLISRDSPKNLIDLPEGFHANHPQYSEWIHKQIKEIEETRDVTTDDINNIIYEAKCHFQIAWENYLETGDNINDYFKTLD